MKGQTLNKKEAIVEAAHQISVGDKLLVNNRERYLDVVKRYDFYKDNSSVKEFFILEGNGTKYLFAIYWTSNPLIYTGSNFSIKESEYTDGYKFTTDKKSSERVRKLFVSSSDHCDNCNCVKLHDSQKEEFYCPNCEV